jgi:hypothetical protein
MAFTLDDLKFLRIVGIADDTPLDDAVAATAEEESSATQPDGTIRLLEEYGIPVTRENYLHLAFMGNPPPEPLDGEIEAELPEELRIDVVTEAWKKELKDALKARARKR